MKERQLRRVCLNFSVADSGNLMSSWKFKGIIAVYPGLVNLYESMDIHRRIDLWGKSQLLFGDRFPPEILQVNHHRSHKRVIFFATFTIWGFPQIRGTGWYRGTPKSSNESRCSMETSTQWLGSTTLLLDPHRIIINPMENHHEVTMKSHEQKPLNHHSCPFPSLFMVLPSSLGSTWGLVKT